MTNGMIYLAFNLLWVTSVFSGSRFQKVKSRCGTVSAYIHC
ncbi:Hypothetical protein ABZS17G119_00304 [Kosakonia cowanii]